MPRPNAFVLTLSCRDTRGVVHAVAGALDEADRNIVDSRQFRDVESVAVAVARAVRWHVVHRVLPNGRKTDVFR